MSELSTLADRHCHQNITPTAVPRLTLSRAYATTKPWAVMYNPLLCVVAQGSKQIFLGDEEFRYDPNSYLIASMDLPVTGRVVEAPCLGITLALEPPLLAALLSEMPSAGAAQAASKAMAVTPLDADLLDPLLRLLRLLDRPADIPVMAPLIEREILYRLLLGPRGEMLRQFALPSSQLSQVGAAINVIRQRYVENLRIEELARAAGMSATSFHRHFRAVTTMSPLQYQKRIRLQQARHMLLTQNLGAAHVAYEVGYESPSQFCREYGRLFGLPPGQDASRARREMAFGENGSRAAY